MQAGKAIVVWVIPLVFGVLAATCSVFGADTPSVKLALSFKPVQGDVEIETPAPNEYSQCKVKVERSGKSSGWIVFGAAGQVLRRFVDSNGDDVVDQWRYYYQGLEVYRDIDANFNNKVDQSRWLNTAGSRWGLDVDEDGKLDSWKVISAEETCREAIRAMITGNETSLQTLLVTRADLESLGINEAVTKKMLEAVDQSEKKMRDAVSGSKTIGPKTTWMRFDSLMPSTIPAEQNHSRDDLTVYENAMAIVETNGEPGLVQIGEMVLVGKVWKLTQIPQPFEGNTLQVTVGGLLMQPVLASMQATGAAGEVSAVVRQLLDDLQELDRDSPSPTAAATLLTRYNTRRADLLAKLVSASKSDEERVQWTRQMVDGIAAAVQTGIYEDGLERLKTIEAEVRRDSLDSPMLAYVSYRRLLAEYSFDMQKANNDKRQEVQRRWLTELERFATTYPNAEDAPDAMLQLAIANEFGGNLKDARKWYGTVVDDHGKTGAGIRAAGSVRRLNLPGKTLTFQGAGLKGGKIDADGYRGKVLLVLFWATWCQPCAEDLPQIRDLYQRYHKRGFEILGVGLDTTPDSVSGYLTKNEVSWPQIFEPGGLESGPARAFGIISLPTMFLVDKRGKVVSRNASVQTLKSQLPELLKK